MSYGVEYSPQEKKSIKDGIVSAAQNGAINLLAACQETGYSYYTVFCWLKDDDVFNEQWQAAKEAAKERRLDKTELQLIKAADNGDMAAIIFTLKTQGRARDYNDRVQIDTNINVEIDVSEAARRIAFAMNSAIDSGKVIEGNYQEILGDVKGKTEQKKLEHSQLVSVANTIRAEKKRKAKAAKPSA